MKFESKGGQWKLYWDKRNELRFSVEKIMCVKEGITEITAKESTLSKKIEQ